MSSAKWRWLRRTAQILALLLFLYLLLGIRTDGSTALPHDFFFAVDPLAGISAMMAGRTWLIPMVIGGVLLLVLTLIFGRFWCGWLCPMGTILDWTRLRRRFRNPLGSPSRWQHAKYFVLFAILFSAILGSQTLIVLDPITLLYRTFASVILPATDSVVTSAESFFYRFKLLQGPLDSFDGFLRDNVFPVEQSFFWPSLLVVFLFIGILALNAIRPRFWCRYLCPLGALLGVVSKASWLRRIVDQKACISCQRCAEVCPSGAIDPHQDFVASPADCIVCLRCTETCPTKAIAFRGQYGVPELPSFDPSRRRLLASLAGIAVGVAILRSLPVLSKTKPMSIRPPGASEASLMSRCIRCGQCINVCPTGGLKPSLTQAGAEDLWTPVLVPRHGHCDYSCTRCGDVCPTEAIKKLPLKEKQQTKIGTSRIDRERCIPWAEGRNCIVCQEMCPLPKKAIWLEDHEVFNELGKITTVRRPWVIADSCIGCGICEQHCPLNGESAIRVYATESLDALIP